jgi:hypothetical protein
VVFLQSLRQALGRDQAGLQLGKAGSAGDECTRYNASTIIRVPTEFGSPATCFMQAQAYLAQSPEGQELELDRDARVKLVCVRSEIVAGIPLQRM